MGYEEFKARAEKRAAENGLQKWQENNRTRWQMQEYDGSEYNTDLKNVNQFLKNDAWRSSADADQYLSTISQRKAKLNSFKNYLSSANIEEKTKKQLDSDYSSILKSYDEMEKLITQSKNYWSQWDSSEAYEKDKAAVAEQERLSSIDRPALEKQIDQLKAQIQQYENDKYFRGVKKTRDNPQLMDFQKESIIPAKGKELLKQYDSWQSQLSQLTNDLKQSEKLEKLTAFEKLRQNADFEKGVELGRSKQGKESYFSTSDGDFHNAIVKIEESKKRSAEQGKEDTSALLISPELQQYNLAELSLKEIETYYYQYGQDEKSATEYIKLLNETLNYRKAQKMFNQLEGHTFGEIAFGAAAGLDQFTSGIRGAFSKEEIPVSDVQIISQMAREDLSDAGPKVFGNSLGQWAYDFTTTTSNMAPSILLGAVLTSAGIPGAGAIASATMGASAGGNAKMEALRAGYTLDQANSYGLLVGASEATLQYLLGGINKLGGAATKGIGKAALAKIDSVVGKIAINYGLEMAGEFTEEYLQEILNPVFRNICLDENNEFKVFTEEALYSGIMGALSAGILNAGGTVSDVRRLSNIGKTAKTQNLVTEMQKLGSLLDPQSTAAKMTQKLTDKTSNLQIGGTMEALSGEVHSNTKSAVESRMRELGASKDIAEGLSDVVIKFANHEKLSPKEENWYKPVIEAHQAANELRNHQINGEQTALLRNIEKRFEDLNRTEAAEAEATEENQSFTQQQSEDIMEAERGENNGGQQDAERTNDGSAAVRVPGSVPGEGQGNEFNGSQPVYFDAGNSGSSGTGRPAGTVYRGNTAVDGGAGDSNAEVLGRRLVSAVGGGDNHLRQSGKNSRKMAEYLGVRSRNDGAGKRIQGGLCGWLETSNRNAGVQRGGLSQSVLGDLSRKRLNKKDSVGRQLSPELQERLADTALKDSDGTILSLYHWTNAKFDQFEKGDVGFHFGTLEAANTRRNQKAVDNETGYYKEAYLNIKNPVFINDDRMKWDTLVVAEMLRRQGIFTASDIAALEKLDGYCAGKYNSEATVALRKLIKEKGYDGIVYTNGFEGDYSVIAFDPEQIITVAENGILKENSGVSEADTPATAMESASPFTEIDVNQGPVEESDMARLIRYSRKEAPPLTQGQRKVVEIGKKLGRQVEFDYSGDPRTAGWGYLEDGVIHMNRNAENPVLTTFKHELTHTLENTEGYQAFSKKLMESESFTSWLTSHGYASAAEATNAVMENRKRAGHPVTVAQARREVVADFVGEVLFGGKGEQQAVAALTELAQTQPKWYDRILSWVRNMVAKFKGTAQERDLQRLEELFTRAYHEAASTENTGVDREIAYSIQYTIDNRPVVVVEEDILNGVPRTQWVKTIKKTIQDKFSGGIPVSGRLVKVNRITGNEFVNSQDSQRLRNTHRVTYRDKFRSANNLDEIVLASTNYVNEDLKHERKDNFKEFARGDVLIRVGNNDYSAQVIIGFTGGNNMVLYDVIGFSPTDIKIADTQYRYAKNAGSDRKDVSADITIPQKAQSVNTQDMQKTKNDTQKFSVPDFGTLYEAVNSGTVSREDFVQMMNEQMHRYVEKNGAIPKGENPAREINVPKKTMGPGKVRRFVRTILETDSGKVPDEMVPYIEGEIVEGNLSYNPISDKSAMKEAQRTVDMGTAETEWENAVKGNNNHFKKKDIAVGEALLQQYAERHDVQKFLETAGQLAEIFTNAGQIVQSARLLKKMDGIGWLYTTKRIVDRINNNLKKGVPEVKINEALAEQLIQAKTPEDFDIAYGEMERDIAQQIPATWWERWNEWRFTAMLANLRTHFRNVLGNVIFLPAVRIKDVVSAVAERFLLDQGQRTKSVIIKNEYREFAQEDFKNVEKALKGDGLRNPGDNIMRMRRIFKNAALEKARTLNYDLMEKEDGWFLRRHYVHALAGFLQARGVDLSNITQEQIQTAQEYAIKEAQKATYRDASKVATAINQFSRSHPIVGVFVEGLMPFKKTPINILKRGVEYSPAGVITTLGKAIVAKRNGEFNASQLIDGFSASLTGTGLFLLGAFLYSIGAATGAIGDDEEDWFRKLNGEQDYSINLFGESVTIDWAAPLTMPFFSGVECMAMLEQEGFNDFAAVCDALALIAEPMINMSMLSGLNDVLTDVSYKDQKWLAAANSALSSYISQSIPTLGGQIARTVDGTQRKNYVDKNSPVPSFVQEIGNTLTGKIPGLSFQKEPYVDAWGERNTDKNVLSRAVQNFISPSYLSKIDYDEVDRELQRLYDETGEAGVFPDTASKSIQYDGHTKQLTAEEYRIYAEEKGTLSRQLVGQLILDSTYQELSDEDKAYAVNELYKFANAVAKTKVSDYEMSGTNAKIEKFQGIGVPPEQMVVAQIATNEENADANGSGSVDTDEYERAIQKTSLPEQTKLMLIYARRIQNKKNRKELEEQFFNR